MLGYASSSFCLSEAVEVAAQHDDTKYSLGSVLNHVLLQEAIIGEEAMLQVPDAQAQPDVIIGRAGGGSNFAGLVFPYLREKIAGRLQARVIAVEPAARPTLTRGRNLSGHYFDMQAYTDCFAGKLQDVGFQESELDAALGELPEVALV